MDKQSPAEDDTVRFPLHLSWFLSSKIRGNCVNEYQEGRRAVSRFYRWNFPEEKTNVLLLVNRLIDCPWFY